MEVLPYSLLKMRRIDRSFSTLLRGGSTRLKITWVQQRQYHRAHGSARERVLSLALNRFFRISDMNSTLFSSEKNKRFLIPRLYSPLTIAKYLNYSVRLLGQANHELYRHSDSVRELVQPCVFRSAQ